jgi:uncharacterized protein
MPNIVLDTNVVLDWLHFKDASMSDLAASIQSQQVIVLANDLTLDELRRVLSYSKLNLTIERQSELVDRYRSSTRSVDMPSNYSRDNLLLPHRFPRCRDSDDQHFLALAFHSKAFALLTKDKALLKLRNKVRRFELRIVHPTSANELSGAA